MCVLRGRDGTLVGIVSFYTQWSQVCQDILFYHEAEFWNAWQTHAVSLNISRLQTYAILISFTLLTLPEISILCKILKVLRKHISTLSSEVYKSKS